ncbi:MAG: hypothetical protein AB7W28_04975 [Armatimonadota bacterium]
MTPPLAPGKAHRDKYCKHGKEDWLVHSRHVLGTPFGHRIMILPLAAAGSQAHDFRRTDAKALPVVSD